MHGNDPYRCGGQRPWWLVPRHDRAIPYEVVLPDRGCVCVTFRLCGETSGLQTPDEFGGDVKGRGSAPDEVEQVEGGRLA
jgi:hypothetical protein